MNERPSKQKVRKQKICKQGHSYFKSSDCSTCPICEALRKPKDGFLSLLVAPARRALEANGITDLNELSKYSTRDILKFHGIGKSSLPKLEKALRDQGLRFRDA